MNEPTVKSLARCSKCRSDSITLKETWDGATIYFEVVAGQRQVNGILDNGHPSRLDGECSKCSHAWRFRSAIQAETLDESVSQEKV